MNQRPRPFRFCAGEVIRPTRAEWTDRARQIEAYGYDTLGLPDHFAQQLAPVPALLSAAMATTLRIATMVFDNDFRHPGLLANEAATLDLLSDGRFEMGIGAGWKKAEYDAAGIPFDPPGIRVERLMEAVQIIKALWRGDEVHHAGQHYAINGLNDPVRPVQQPGPPLFIGGGGKRMLSFAAREADIVGLIAKALPDGGLDFTDIGEEAIARKAGWVREAAGERVDDLELSILVWGVVVTDDPRGVAEQMTGGVPDAPTVDEFLRSPHFLIGSLDSIADRLDELRDRFGISYVMVGGGDVDALAPVVARLKSS